MSGIYSNQFSQTIDFDLTEAANALDIPLIGDGLHTNISDIFDAHYNPACSNTF